MLKKPDCWYEQSGVIPYRRHPQCSPGGHIEVLLITTRKGKRWVIPKGIIEPAMTPEESAAKEAFEEAGVEGVISATAIGVYMYEKWGGTCQVEVFPMSVTRVLEEWPEADFRTREWMSIDEAVARVREETLQSFFRALPEVVLMDRDG